jgi:cyclohexyl-isocyanide hydratase
MKPREFACSLSAALAGSARAGRLTAQSHRMQSGANLHSSVPSGPPQPIGMVIYPNMTALDFIGPHTFLAGLLNVQVHLLWKPKELIVSARGVPIQATTSFRECPENLDILFVPGGSKGTISLMNDPEVVAFLGERRAGAKYVTSVCTGALLLGAAGLLKGYRSTSHWAYRDLLPLFGAQPAAERVVIDRNRITSVGVTSGIDFGLVLSARMRDARFAEMQQLAFEYDPHPPFRAGTPEQAGPEIAGHLRTMFAPNHDAAKKAAEQAQRRLAVA